ncbi:hypothetical protein CB0940_02963 [Cercospora beticola]|uniref:Plasma membrane proteolipid 3 n=1 Tax=Cercospora beticola TaxID=122368 RepID=A0A2G5I5A3_CERBT|nr:hypothetical protein CB0940_02963 [Cercospora beticola]PIA99985.1 hypothetical protein CB0940_02963 [Cercospora beticola]WPB00123.1 hypothetical protein RHO25_004742 [Cercospora beticola]CAK1361694.1 unnamed protein product [Cercospora beticola]
MVLGGTILAIIAIFLPPLPVIIRRGCSGHVLLNILLCILGWIPGILHAWYIILETPSLRKRHRRRSQSRVIREEVYVPPRHHSRTRSRSRSVPPVDGYRRTRSRSVGRIAAPPPADVYARQPYYREEVYYDNRGAPPPRSKYY